MSRKKLFLLPVFFFIAALQTSKIHAQEASIGINVSPPLTHVVIMPGRKTTTIVDLENTGTHDVNITTHFTDFSSDGNSGIPILTEKMSFPFITLVNEKEKMDTPFLIGSGQKKQLLFGIDLPEDAVEKEYHFSLVNSVSPEQNTLNQNTEAALSGEVVNNFIVTVTRSDHDRGSILVETFISPKIVDGFGSISPKVWVKNVGMNTTVTVGDLKITNMFGQLVYQNEFIPQNILPESIRELMGSNTILKEGLEWKTPQSFHYKPLYLIGPYTLTFTYHSPGQNIQTYKQTIFAFPFSILIFLLVGICIYLLYTKIFPIIDIKHES